MKFSVLELTENRGFHRISRNGAFFMEDFKGKFHRKCHVFTPKRALLRTLLTNFNCRRITEFSPGAVLRKGGGGQFPPNLGLCDMKQCLTNSYHHHRCKTAFCGLQNTPKCVSSRGSAPDPAGSSNPSRLVRGQPSHIQLHSAPLIIVIIFNVA